ncbi:hypothetical protein G6514_004950 [Epicoccum nigrum]|nr:hypothetical protein G6514_004950 [Epicoccum nigrum]
MSTESPTKCDLPEIISGDPPRVLSGDASKTPSGDSPKIMSGDAYKTLSGDAPASENPYIYHLIEDVEPIERYGAGGYYPVRIGDQLCSSQYRIVHKLGHGASSTIWLARDEHLAKYVAIKIAVSELERPFESAILRTLWDKEGCTIKSHAGVALVPDILYEFVVEGPEIKGVRRKHQCLVTTPARMNILYARDFGYGRPFQIMVARAVAAQVTQAVAGLHSRGVLHADLHEGNILFRLPNAIDDLTTDQLYEKYRKPYIEEVKRFDGLPLDPWVPTHGIIPVWLGAASDKISLAESRIFLNDFSESYQPAVDPQTSSHTPFALRSPELFMEPEAPISFSAEIWSLACVIFSIMGERTLFDSWFPSKDAILALHIDTLGRLPDEWWVNWENRAKFFDDQNQRINGDSRRSLEDRLEFSIQKPRWEHGMATMDDEEKQAFLELMGSMLKYRPEDRISAQQALESRWMQNWAKPAFESMEDMARTPEFISPQESPSRLP